MGFSPSITGLLVIDPYNDFISEGGKVWDRLRMWPKPTAASRT